MVLWFSNYPLFRFKIFHELDYYGISIALDYPGLSLVNSIIRKWRPMIIQELTHFWYFQDVFYSFVTQFVWNSLPFCLAYLSASISIKESSLAKRMVLVKTLKGDRFSRLMFTLPCYERFHFFNTGFSIRLFNFQKPYLFANSFFIGTSSPPSADLEFFVQLESHL